MHKSLKHLSFQKNGRRTYGCDSHFLKAYARQALAPAFRRLLTDSAVTQFERWQPHLIWMDMRMPVMDGLEASRRIRASKAGGEVKIIAVTAHALEDEQRDILEVGCDGFIRKPYRDREIYDALSQHLGLKFVYEEVSGDEVELDASELADLPGELRGELEQALVRLDSAAVKHVIEKVRDHNSSLAEALAGVARDLQYSRLLQFIRDANGNS